MLLSDYEVSKVSDLIGKAASAMGSEETEIIDLGVGNGYVYRETIKGSHSTIQLTKMGLVIANAQKKFESANL